MIGSLVTSWIQWVLTDKGKSGARSLNEMFLNFFSAEKRVSRLACGFAHFVHPIIPAVQLLSARGRTRTSSSYKG